MKEIKLSRGKIAFVDDCDFDAVCKITWNAHKDKNTFYARTNISKKLGKSSTVTMHNFLMGRSINGLVIDHINGNGLDNRRENLRFVTNRHNSQNTVARRLGKTTSRYVGVNWMKSKNKWRAEAMVNGKRRHLGLFLTEELAASAYLVAIGEKLCDL